MQNKGRSEGHTKWNKEKYTGNQQWREGKQDSNQLFGTKKEINVQLEQNEETRVWKNEERFRNLQDNFKYSNIWIIGVPEGEEEEQEIENLFEQIMKENFSNLAKEMDIQAQELQRVPKKLDQRRNTTRHIIIKLPKIKDKERILKAAEEKQSYLQRHAHKMISWFLKRNLAGKKGLEKSIQSHEKQGPTTEITLSSKAIN